MCRILIEVVEIIINKGMILMENKLLLIREKI